MIEETSTHRIKDGVAYDRVTAVIDAVPSPSLVEAKVKIGKREWNRRGRAAIKVGSRVDELATEDFCYGARDEKKKEKDEVKSCLAGWDRFKEEHGELYRDIVGMQEVVFYEDWLACGCLDIRTTTAIIDIKTSARRDEYPAYWVQTAFYNRKHKLPECYVLRLDKELGDFELIPRPEKFSQDYLEEVFVSMLNVKRFYGSEEE